MRNVECALDVAAVRILALAVEHLAIVFVVVQINGTVERQQNDLRNLLALWGKQSMDEIGCAESIGLE